MIALQCGCPMKEIFNPNYRSIWDFCLDNSFPSGLLVSLGNDQGEGKESSKFQREEIGKTQIFFCFLVAKSCLTL